MKYFVFPNLPNDVWLGDINEPDKCKLVCSCPKGMNSTHRYEIINQDDMICAQAETLDDARHARDTYVSANPIRLRAYIWDVWAKKEVK